MLKDAEKNREEDRKQKRLVEARNDLNEFAYEVNNKLFGDNSSDSEKVKQKLNENEMDSIEEKIVEVIEWLEEHDITDVTGNIQNENKPTVDMYEKKLEEISTFVRPFLNRCGYYVAGGNLFDLNNLKPDHFNGFVREKELGLTIENVDP